MEYRKCFVPTCSNNSNNSPNKIFVRIREDLREKWCRDVDVEYCKVYTMYCCEDHFDPKKDLTNYYQHKLMNQEPRLKPTASLCYIAPNKSENSTELTKQLLQHATTRKPVKRKYEDTIMRCSSSYSIIPVQVIDDADPSVSDEDDDGDDSDTPVESNMCRVCLALDVKMYDLRDNELKIMFHNITGIMFNEENCSVLGSLCWECAARLKAAASFRSKALLSDSLLQNIVTSGEQIRKNDITALKQNALCQGLISANTLTVIDVFHIVDIEDQNNTTQLLQSGDDGDLISISENIDTEKSIIEEIKDENSEMDFEVNVPIKAEIEGDITSPNTEAENRTNIKEKRPVDFISSSVDTIKSAYCSLLMDMGLTDERNPQENCENDINKTVVRKSLIEGIKEEDSEMAIEDDNNVAIKTEIGDDTTSPNNEEKNTEGENPVISLSSQDKIGSDYSSLLLNIGQSLLPSDILRSPQEESDADITVISKISKSDLISITRPQHITEPASNNSLIITKKNCTSHDHTYYLKPDTLDTKKRNKKKRFVVIINKDSKQKVEKRHESSNGKYYY